MKIVFDKVGQTDKPFREEEEGVVLEGTLQKSGSHRVRLNAEIDGVVEVQCNRCGKTFDSLLTGPLRLTISDQFIETKDDLDIIEFLDGGIDISFILQSEITTLKSAYHYCKQCEESTEAFDVEY